jgi:two-component system CheB/CheR fusion protein
LQNLMASTDIATLFLDRQLRIKRFTPAVARVLNIMPADVGRPIGDFTHKIDGYATLAQDAEGVLESLQPVIREVTEPDGRRFLMRLLPYRTADYRIDGVVLTLVDISPIRAAERALEQSEEIYRLVVESTHEYAIFTMDSTGRVDTWNPGAERIFGYTDDEIIGQMADVIFTDEDRRAGVPEDEMRRAVLHGDASDERWHVRKNQDLFWASGVMTALKEDGQLRGFAKVLRDNTRHKELDEQREQVARKLQASRSFLERQVELSAEQIRGLAAELAASDQNVRQRISQVLHDDLQQLLYALAIQVQIHQEDVAAEDLSSSEGQRLSEIASTVQEALDLTRRLVVEVSPPAIEEKNLVEALHWLQAHMRESYRLEVNIDSASDSEMLSASARAFLYQAVQELLFNVVKHAQTSTARVSLHQEDHGLRVVVEDGGQGFDLEAESSDRPSHYGLRTIRDRLTLLGGRLDVESRPGDGTRATIHMPYNNAFESSSGGS